MKTVKLPNSVTRKLYRVGLKVKKHSPEALMVVGVVGVVSSAVMACKATTKANTILENTKTKIDAIHECEERFTKNAEYTQDDKKKDLAIVYTQTGLEFVKLYGPSVALGVASIGCIIASHGILRKRNAALAAAYTAIDSGFKQYRSRVVERFGEDLDRELRFNLKEKDIEETTVNEDGSEQTVTKTVTVSDKKYLSDYAKCFDEYCAGYERNAAVNLLFLKAQQNHANELLQSRGHLFLNEVYDMLGIPRTKLGQIVGWIYTDGGHPTGDNYVDFGIYEAYNADFVNGREKVAWLDFNVDGEIYDML